MKKKFFDKSIYLFLFLVVVVAFYLRVKDILFQSFWYDELYSIFVSNPVHSLKEVIFWETKDVHPPLYQISLWFVFKIFGFSETVARSFSLFWGVLSIVFLFLQKLFDRYCALLGSSIAATMPFLIWYSQETRSYSMLFAFTTISAYLFVTIFNGFNKMLFLFFVLSELCMVYTHYFGFLIVFGFEMVAFLLLLIDKKHKTFFYQISFAHFLVIIFYLPWLKYFFFNRGFKTTWIKPPDQ